jgi:hypothetical protein
MIHMSQLLGRQVCAHAINGGGEIAPVCGIESAHLGGSDRPLRQSGAASDEPLGPKKQHQDQEGARRMAQMEGALLDDLVL